MASPSDEKDEQIDVWARLDELKDQKKYDAALALASSLLQTIGSIPGGVSPRMYALVYGHLGTIHYEMGDLVNARKYAELALNASVEAQDAEGVLAHVRNIHVVAKSSQDYADMEQWAAVGANCTEQLGRHAESVEWQLSIAEAQALQGRSAEAVEVLRAAVSKARTALGDDQPRLSIFLNNAAELLRRDGAAAEAQPLYEEAIRVRRSCGLIDVTLSKFLLNLAFLHQQQKDHKRAESLLLETLSLQRALLPADDALIPQTLNNLGTNCYQLGDTAQARAYFEEAVRLRSARAPDKISEQATTLHNWAALEMERGDDSKAKALLDQLGEASSTHAQDGLEQVHRMEQVATLYERLGKYDQAEHLRRQVLASVQRADGTDSESYATALAALADVRAHQGDSQQAEQLFKEAIERMRPKSSADDDEFSRLLNNYGLFCYNDGNYTEAEKALEEALARRRRTLAPRDVRLLDTINNLGLVRLNQQRADEAESLLVEVLAERREALMPDHPNTAQSLFNLGMLYADRGRVAEALPLLKEQFEIEDRLLANIFAVASESERLAYAAKLRHNLNVLMMKMMDWDTNPEAVRIAFEVTLRRKGIVVETLARDRSVALDSESSPARDLLQQLNAIRSRIARAILDGSTGDPIAYETELSRLNQEREQLESKLARSLSATAIHKGVHADCESVAAALPPGTALLEFVKFQLIAAGLAPDQDISAYAVFVLPSQEPSGLAMHLLGTGAQMESAVEVFRASITADAEVFRRRNFALEDVNLAATELDMGLKMSQVLIERLRPSLRGRNRLLIATDGMLNRLPFETLPLTDGRRATEEFEISYLSSGRDLLRIGSASTHASGPAVVVANPDFDLGVAGASGDPAIVHFSMLEDTKTEGEWVAAKLGVQCWMGDEALEARVKRSRSPRILHFATHGFFLPGPPAKQGATKEASAQPEASSKQCGNPLLRSGLALAGANRWLAGDTLPEDAEDGLLLAEDVCSMDLLGTDLVILSACETGLGEYRSGEGVFGLRRAFELAGAGSLVMSLWRVPSGPTCELMKEFYRQLSQRKRRSEALREAQRVLRRRYPETLAWGAFVLSGNPAAMVEH